MEDNFGRVIAGVIGVLFLFFLPVLNISLKSDNTSQAYIDNAVVEFVDNARATGQITDEAYEKMCSKIDLIQPFCDIQISHSSKYAVGDGHGGYEICYFAYQKSDILDTIYTQSGENKPYYLKHGDFLQVTVVNTQPTLATKLYRLIMPQYNPNNVTLYTCYSGYVGNKPE